MQQDARFNHQDTVGSVKHVTTFADDWSFGLVVVVIMDLRSSNGVVGIGIIGFFEDCRP
jgi:hypothetical protein